LRIGSGAPVLKRLSRVLYRVVSDVAVDHGNGTGSGVGVGRAGPGVISSGAIASGCNGSGNGNP
jgi:hypothetical protein